MSAALVVDKVTCIEHDHKKNTTIVKVWTARNGCFSCFDNQWDKFNVGNCCGRQVAILYSKKGDWANIVDIKQCGVA